MTIQEKILQIIGRAFENLYNHQFGTEELSLQPTRKEFVGNYTFVTFPYSKITKAPPHESAAQIGEFIKTRSDLVSDYNVVKGFLNISVSDTYWLEILNHVAKDEQFDQHPSNGEKVMVEYSSPNTNKPLHLGHLRNNFLGYSVAEVLKANGFEVIRANLVNDRGIHICKSMVAYLRFGQDETPDSSGLKGDHLVGKYYVIFDSHYKNQIAELEKEGMPTEEAKKNAPLLKEAQELLVKWEAVDKEVTELWKTMNGWVYEGFDVTYKTMGVEFDQFYYESNTYLLGKNIVEEGLEKKVFFKKEDGSVWANLEEEGLEEKLVLRGDGTSVYITQDLGTADLKYRDHGINRSVYVVGNEQDYHFEVLFAILKKLGRPYAGGLYHLSYGMVDLPSGKMKSREGTVVDADDLIQEMIETAASHTQELGKIEGFSEEQANELYKTLGMGALKYFLLKVDPKKRILFNPQESIEFQGNTGPFIQYSHARISSILRKATQIGMSLSDGFEGIDHLEDPERELVFLLNSYKEKIKLAGEAYSPSIIAQYLFDLAKEYNRFYAELPIFNESDKRVQAFRVVLSAQVAKTIRSGMKLLGIEVPEKM